MSKSKRPYAGIDCVQVALWDFLSAVGYTGGVYLLLFAVTIALVVL